MIHNEQYPQPDEAKAVFSRELLAWYQAGNRNLPWRKSRDPYRVWVSEIMLQQTRVDTVIPYYLKFMDRFPTVKALAEAPEEDVLKRWEGLGYYSRARNLQAGARQVMELYGGVVPDDTEAVAGLKGVGPYTKGAIMSIAFNRPEPAVDGNVMRVLSRYFCLEDDIAKPSTRTGIEKLAVSLIPEGAAGDFNQALMELGALVCTPKSPGCLTCPVMSHCAGRIAGKENELPVKTKAKPPKPQIRLGALIAGTGEHAGKVLVRQRPDSGLLARMWELPHVLLEEDGAAADKPRGRRAKTPAAPGVRASHGRRAGSQAEPDLEERAADARELRRLMSAETGLIVSARSWLAVHEHTFSHLHWTVKVYLAELGESGRIWSVPLAAAESAAAYSAAPGRGGGENGGKPGSIDRGGDSGSDISISELSISAGNEAGGGKPRLGSIGGEFAVGETRGASAVGESGGASEGLAPTAGAADKLPPGYRWIGPEQMRELAFPNLFAKILNDYWDEAD
ncbi:A/G-specific adenine glycosylase [Paenibacillus beijingensis]|uniref:Adenine DNA glycosylase n=1 Tax=Paenibacillus beijingensis TaxID=1126833 RepID=A0A0D5NFS6_9BACL|nr:A/G-specific adenine glycosylase [Paenibacillus beijingensis]AJY74005.1 hypothetical protein VN24_04505 [Paenibacillus beijingensis]